MSEDRFVFVTDWYDQAACITRQYHLSYYFSDSTIDMYDLKYKRTFLKRTEYPTIKLNDLYIGAVINIYSR